MAIVGGSDARTDRARALTWQPRLRSAPRRFTAPSHPLTGGPPENERDRLEHGGVCADPRAGEAVWVGGA